MGFSTVTSGTIITATWGNEKRDQCVTPFSSTSARDSAIVSPVAGMVQYITSNDINEGITTRCSNSVWRLPWNMPWGIVASAERDIAQGSIGDTFTDLTGLSVTFTAVGNRKYLVQGAVVFGNPGNVLVRNSMRLVNGAATVLHQNVDWRAEAAESHDAIALQRVITGLSAGSNTLKLQAKASTGGTIDTGSGTGQPACLYVYDVGPNGAPA